MSKQPTRVEHHPTYFIDEPRRHGRDDYEAVLIYWNVFQMKKSERREMHTVSFVGNTRDEVDEKLVAWVEKTGAVEATLDEFERPVSKAREVPR